MQLNYILKCMEVPNSIMAEWHLSDQPANNRGCTKYRKQPMKALERKGKSTWELEISWHLKEGRGTGRVSQFYTLAGPKHCHIWDRNLPSAYLQEPEGRVWGVCSSQTVKRGTSWKGKSHSGGAPNSIYKLFPNLCLCPDQIMVNADTKMPIKIK